MPKSNLRTEYVRSALLEDDAGDDPIALFGRWYEEAVHAGGRDPNAMSLATTDAGGHPSVRIVLCKEFDHAGFVFFTNYSSRKGRDLSHNPNGCLLFYWPDLERQVRVSGAVQTISTAESDAYFAERPLAARIGAWASPQSEPIAGRESLERRYGEMEQRFAGQATPPRPPHWGGYRLVPDSLEFWQGRPSRLHDRLLFSRRGVEWELVRLAP
ncbi:Pyridoxine/pyridoxamine 5'-phosphate oxidase [Burkholderiales bacterium]|nr:Pyridoxine/pyridoxamine 5'-phosphate oxidase [Burkholderiales bacterium]